MIRSYPIFFRDTPTRYSNGASTLQSILTVATSCGSSKNSLTSVQLSSSQQQQTNSKLASSPSTSHDERYQRSYDLEMATSINLAGMNASNGELEVVNEAESENEITIPGIIQSAIWLAKKIANIFPILMSFDLLIRFNVK